MTDRSVLNTIFKTRKAALAASAALGLVLASCGGGGGGSSAPVSPPPPPPPAAPTGLSFSLAGSAMQGIVLNGYVEVADSSNPSEVIASGRTSGTDGAYSLTIPGTAGFNGPFVRVTVSGGPGATMICDAAPNCGPNVAFGETFAIDNTVAISTLVPTPAEGTSDDVYITTFTDIAAALADQLAANEGGLTQGILDRAKSQVANLLGTVTSQLETLPSIDITSVTTTDASEDALRNALLNGGVLGALLETGRPLGQAISTFRDEFVANGGQLIANESVDNPLVISLEDILDDTIDAGEMSPLEGPVLDKVAASLLGYQADVSTRTADELTSALETPFAGRTDLDKVKFFVCDLEAMVEAIEAGDTILSQDVYETRVEQSSGLLVGPAGSLVGGLATPLEAFFEAYAAYVANPSLTSFTTDEGIAVSINPGGNSVGLALQASAPDGTAYNLTASVANGTGVSGFLPGGPNVTIAGTANNGLFQMTITNGVVEVTESVAVNDIIEPATGSAANTDVEFGILDLALNVTLDDADGASSYAGGLFVEIVGLKSGIEYSFDKTDEFLNGNNTGNSLDPNDFGLTSSRLGFNGDFSESGAQFGASYSLNLGIGLVDFENNPDSATYANYTVQNNAINVDYPLLNGRRDELRFIDRATADGEVARFNTSDFGGGIVGLFDLAGNFVGLAGLDSTVEDVFRLQEFENNAIARSVYTQSNLADDTLGGQSTAAFLASPPTNDIVDWLAGARGTDLQPFLICADDRLLVAEPFVFGPNSGSIDSVVLADFATPDFGASGPVVTPSIFANEGAAGEGQFVSVSARGNFMSSDPQDPELRVDVESELFAVGSVDFESASSDFTLFFEFAGRRFRTTGPNFDVFRDNDTPVVVTNQDGAILTIDKDANGLSNGNVVLNGVEHATISQDADGVITVRFSDDAIHTF